MDSRHALLVRFTPANYVTLKAWAKSQGLNLTAALNVLVSNLADTAQTPTPNNVRVAPEKPQVKRKLDSDAVVSAWSDAPDDDDDPPNFGS
jgi:hypothetical protein